MRSKRSAHRRATCAAIQHNKLLRSQANVCLTSVIRYVQTTSSAALGTPSLRCSATLRSTLAVVKNCRRRRTADDRACRPTISLWLRWQRRDPSRCCQSRSDASLPRSWDRSLTLMTTMMLWWCWTVMVMMSGDDHDDDDNNDDYHDFSSTSTYPKLFTTLQNKDHFSL